MILACPFCQTRFLVSASLFAAGPRQVQCVRCRHSWRAEMTESGAAPPVEPAVISAAPVAATVKWQSPVTIADIKHFVQNIVAFVKYVCARWEGLTPKQKHYGKKGATGFAIFLIISLFIFDRTGIADRWPVMDRVYGFLHLYVNHYHGGEGLAFEQMRSELRYEGGTMQLVVQGKIHNKSEKVQEIPPLLATALGADGTVIESWQIDAPAANVSPDAEVPFTSSISAPRGTAVNVNVNFIEKKNAAE